MHSQPNDSILARGFLLLGAGASVKAGVPHAAGFVGAIKAYLAALPSSEASPLTRAFDDVVAVLGAQSADGRVGLEPLFETIDDCLDGHHQPATYRKVLNPLKPSRALERLLYEIKRVVQLHCDVRESRQVEYLERLLAELKARGPFPIVSFNYDTVIETACDSFGLRFGEPVIGDDDREGRDIELIKVHGSVAWLHGPKGELVRRSRGTSILPRLGELRSQTLETPLI